MDSSTRNTHSQTPDALNHSLDAPQDGIDVKTPSEEAEASNVWATGNRTGLTRSSLQPSHQSSIDHRASHSAHEPVHETKTETKTETAQLDGALEQSLQSSAPWDSIPSDLKNSQPSIINPSILQLRPSSLSRESQETQHLTQHKAEYLEAHLDQKDEEHLSHKKTLTTASETLSTVAPWDAPAPSSLSRSDTTVPTLSELSGGNLSGSSHEAQSEMKSHQSLEPAPWETISSPVSQVESQNDQTMPSETHNDLDTHPDMGSDVIDSSDEPQKPQRSLMSALKANTSPISEDELALFIKERHPEALEQAELIPSNPSKSDLLDDPVSLLAQPQANEVHLDELKEKEESPNTPKSLAAQESLGSSLDSHEPDVQASSLACDIPLESHNAIGLAQTIQASESEPVGHSQSQAAVKPAESQSVNVSTVQAIAQTTQTIPEKNPVIINPIIKVDPQVILKEDVKPKASGLSTPVGRPSTSPGPSALASVAVKKEAELTLAELKASKALGSTVTPQKPGSQGDRKMTPTQSTSVKAAIAPLPQKKTLLPRFASVVSKMKPTNRSAVTHSKIVTRHANTGISVNAAASKLKSTPNPTSKPARVGSPMPAAVMLVPLVKKVYTASNKPVLMSSQNRRKPSQKKPPPPPRLFTKAWFAVPLHQILLAALTSITIIGGSLFYLDQATRAIKVQDAKPAVLTYEDQQRRLSDEATLLLNDRIQPPVTSHYMNQSSSFGSSSNIIKPSSGILFNEPSKEVPIFAPATSVSGKPQVKKLEKPIPLKNIALPPGTPFPAAPQTPSSTGSSANTALPSQEAQPTPAQ